MSASVVGKQVTMMIDGVEQFGMVTGERIDVEELDVTRDGTLYPFVADHHRVMAPGRTRRVITVEMHQ